MLTKFSLLKSLCLILLMLSLAACGGLAGEPDIVSTVVPPTAEALYPPQSPNLTSGATIYAARCAACHGTNGDGQGPQVLSGGVKDVPSFLDSANVDASRPNEYFDIITNGNLEKLMPPWKDALTLQERWDVAMYVYTLHYDANLLATGAQVYADECMRCHGEFGKGDGVDMIGTGRSATDLSDAANMLSISDNAMLTTVREGVGEVMPAYQGKLTDDQMRAAVAYSRGFTVSNALAPAGAEATEEPLPNSINVKGTITNGTAGSTVPDGLTVYLRYGSAAKGLQTQQATLQADKTFAFADVPVEKDFLYIVFAVYNDRNFTSQVFQTVDLKAETDMSFSIYELTEDPKQVIIKRVELDIEPHEVQGVGSGLIFSERLTYENISDRMYSLPQTIGNGYASVVVQLPPGAIMMSTDDDTRYVTSDEKGIVVDTLPVLPGEHVVQLIYFLPYTTDAIIDQPQTHAIQGDMILHIAPTTLTITDRDGKLVEQPNPQNNPYNTYNGSIDVPFNGTLQFEITGAAVATLTSANPDVVTSNNLLPVLLIGVIVLVLIFGLIILFTRRGGTRPSNNEREIRLLIRQIAELDEMHTAGQVNHDVYQRQRADLKTELGKLMAKSKPTPAEPAGDESAGS